MVINAEIIRKYWKSFKSLESPDDTNYQQQPPTSIEPGATVENGQAENQVYYQLYGGTNTAAISIPT